MPLGPQGTGSLSRSLDMRLPDSTCSLCVCVRRGGGPSNPTSPEGCPQVMCEGACHSPLPFHPGSPLPLGWLEVEHHLMAELMVSSRSHNAGGEQCSSVPGTVAGSYRNEGSVRGGSGP